MNTNDQPDVDPYDVVVIGGGAAGLSAALVLSRARRRVLVVDGGSPRNAPAAHMHGYLSRDGMQPTDLLRVGRAEVMAYNGEIVPATVEQILSADASGFEVLLTGGRRVPTRRLLVATGLRDELPDIPGLIERWARDVLHCPYCHGWEVQDQRLGVLSDGSPESVKYAQIVRQWSADVVLFAPPDTLADEHRSELVARAVGLIEGEPAQVLVEDDRLIGLELSDGRKIPRDALFVPPTFRANNDLLIALGGQIDEQGWVVKDPTGRTSIPGVWVAGNVANPRAQVITAAGEGSAAAIALNADLVDDDIRTAVTDVESGLRP